MSGAETIEMYELTDEERREADLQEVTDINREIKRLQDKKKVVLGRLTDHTKRTNEVDSIRHAYIGMIERGVHLGMTAKEILDEVFVDEDFLLEVFNKCKNSQTHKFEDLFNDNKGNPKQDKLEKDKVINLSGVKSKKTPMHLMNYIHDRKSMKELEVKVNTMDAVYSGKLASMEERINLLEDNDAALAESLSSLKKTIDLLVETSEELPEERVNCYILHLEGIPIDNIQDKLGVSRPTVYRWIKEVKDTIEKHNT